MPPRIVIVLQICSAILVTIALTLAFCIYFRGS